MPLTDLILNGNSHETDQLVPSARQINFNAGVTITDRAPAHLMAVNMVLVDKSEDFLASAYTRTDNGDDPSERKK